MNEQEEPSPLRAHMAKVRSAAEDTAFEVEQKSLKAKRLAEKFMKGRGRAPAYSDVVLSDVRVLEEKGVFEHLMTDAEFENRIAQLNEEVDGAIARAREYGRRAALAAESSPPEDIMLQERHYQERVLFQNQNGLLEADPATMQPSVRGAWRTMLQRQAQELEELKDRERAAKKNGQ
jgi:hypothetical protein